MKTSKIINITHTDLDGVGCPIVLACMTQKTIVPYHCGYHDIEDVLKEILENLDSSIEAIYITDIAMRENSKYYDIFNKLNKQKKYNFVRLVDHHATSKFVNKYSWATSYETGIDGTKQCATYQLFQLLKHEGYASTQALEKFTTLVNLWDTWRWVTDYPEDSPCIAASHLNMVQSIYGKSKFFTEYISKIKLNSDMFEDAEKTVITCKEHEVTRDIKEKNKELMTIRYTYDYHSVDKSFIKFVENYLKNNHICDKNFLLSKKYSHTFNVGVVFTNRNVSDVGNGIAKLHPELDFVALIALPGSISFRSVKDLDVPLGIIANHITGKGGGHPQSAGGVLSKRFSYELLTKILKTN